MPHGYFREKAISFLTRSGREQMIKELQVDQRLFDEAEALLTVLFK
ncbi:hypothetical protein [Candidatus Nitrosoglobus terrae]|nr:hypothetical protein [Candidatus Nitrosoglobus terrae]